MTKQRKQELRVKLVGISRSFGQDCQKLADAGMLIYEDHKRMMRLIARLDRQVARCETVDEIEACDRAVMLAASNVWGWFEWRRRVCESCNNAIENGYPIDTWTPAAIAIDLITCDAQFEGIREIPIQNHARAWLEIRMIQRAGGAYFHNIIQ